MSYPQCAELLANFGELASFRKFSRISLELLLYKQASISLLEQEIECIQKNADNIQSWQSLKNATSAILLPPRAAFSTHRELIAVGNNG